MAEPSRFESVVDQQIRAAQERGEFDDLPGMGKPLPGRGQPDDDLWWVKGYIRREGLSTDALLPTPLQLAREVERLPETAGQMDSEAEVRAAVRELNRRIAEHLAAPSGPRVPVRPVDVDEVVGQWGAARHVATEQPAADGPGPPEPPRKPRKPRKRRWFGRGRSRD